MNYSFIVFILRRKTVRFDEVQDILEVLGYHIEFVRNEDILVLDICLILDKSF